MHWEKRLPRIVTLYFKNECEGFIRFPKTRNIWGLSAGTGKRCIFDSLGLVFFSCGRFVSCLLFLLFYVNVRILCPGTHRRSPHLKARVFEITSPTKKISPNYHLSKLLNSTILFETWNVHDPQKMYMMCMILSPPNNCAKTIFKY